MYNFNSTTKMKSILKTSAFIAMSAIMATSITSCDDNNGENTGETQANCLQRSRH